MVRDNACSLDSFWMNCLSTSTFGTRMWSVERFWTHYFRSWFTLHFLFSRIQIAATLMFFLFACIRVIFPRYTGKRNNRKEKLKPMPHLDVKIIQCTLWFTIRRRGVRGLILWKVEMVSSWSFRWVTWSCGRIKRCNAFLKRVQIFETDLLCIECLRAGWREKVIQSRQPNTLNVSNDK